MRDKHLQNMRLLCFTTPFLIMLMAEWVNTMCDCVCVCVRERGALKEYFGANIERKPDDFH